MGFLLMVGLREDRINHLDRAFIPDLKLTIDKLFDRLR
jgi:hypothetical protein